MPSPPPKTALVIGAGIVGRACALNLKQRGYAVTLADPDSQLQAASWGNAGHIAVEQVEPLASWATLRSAPRRLRANVLGLPLRDIAAWLPFGLRLIAAARPSRLAKGRAALRAILAESLPAWRRLAAAIGRRDLLQERGHFIVWESPETAQAGRAAWAATDIGTATFRDATPKELSTLAALMAAPPAGAIRFTGTAQIADHPALAEALSRENTSLAVAVVDLTLADGTATARLATGECLTPDLIVVATGAAAGDLLRPLGYTVPLIAERGYHIQSPDHRWPADMPTIVFDDRALVVTPFASGLRATSVVEFARASSPPDPRRWSRLRAHAAALGLPFGDRTTEWMGARPTLPDYLPAIGRSAAASNLLYAFGHQHLGLTMAAATGEAIGALADSEPPAFDLTPFNLARFGGPA